MAKVEGLSKVIAQIQTRLAKAKKDAKASVSVGYTAAYAIFVHENLQARHTKGQAKYLEQPARQMRGELGDGIKADLKTGMTMSQALLRAGLRLQRASQKLVPVDTGNLKGSAFTRLDVGGG